MNKTAYPAEKGLHIKSVSKQLHQDLKNVAARQDKSLSKFLADSIRAIVDTYPNDIRDGKACEKSGEIKIRGIGKRTKQELQNVADYYQVDLAALLKIELTDVMDKTHPHLKTKMPND